MNEVKDVEGKDILDLSAIQGDTLDQAVLTIVNPKTNEDTPMRVTLLSPDDAEYKRRQNRLQEAELKRRKGRREVTPEEAETSVLERFVIATVGIEGATINGVSVGSSPDAVRELYRAFPWILDQVIFFQSDRRNFFRG